MATLEELRQFTTLGDESAVREVAQQILHHACYGGSLYSDDNVWSVEVAQGLVDRFINSPDLPNMTFVEKLSIQLSDPKEVCLMAEIVTFSLLANSSIKHETKTVNIQAILDLAGPTFTIPDSVDRALEKGVFAFGQAGSSGKYHQVKFLVHLFMAFMKQAEQTRVDLLASPEEWSAFVATVRRGRPLVIDAAVRYLAFPDVFPPIGTEDNALSITKAFFPAITGTASTGNFNKDWLTLREVLHVPAGVNPHFWTSPLADVWIREDDQELAPQPDDYSPGISVEEWQSLINNKKVFTTKRRDVIEKILELGGEASCTGLALEFGGSASAYQSNAIYLAKRVHEQTSCPLPVRISGDNAYWPILFTGRWTRPDEPGSFVWRVRPELAEALSTVHSSQSSGQRFWWLVASPAMWSAKDMAVGDVQSYTLVGEGGKARKIAQNVLDARVGDPVIFYESTPTKAIVGLGEISRQTDGERLWFRKTDNILDGPTWAELQQIDNLATWKFLSNPQGSLFALTQDEYNLLLDLAGRGDTQSINNTPNAEAVEPLEEYTKESFLDDVFMSETTYNRINEALDYKMNIILQGPPGVGKTYAAERLAFSRLGAMKKDNVQFVQFHQSYSYEDFVEGFRPEGDKFALKDGIFKKFCDKAATNPNEHFYLIIDEINRANVSKVFGELLTIIEASHRGKPATLAYSGKEFYIPANLYIIGMMNTADRSLAFIDYALRRRFAFISIEPGFTTDGFKLRQAEVDDQVFDQLIDATVELNRVISADPNLGKGFQIGHSYFCGEDLSAPSFRNIVDFELVPLLEEYWFDDEEKARTQRETLEAIVK